MKPCFDINYDSNVDLFSLHHGSKLAAAKIANTINFYQVKNS